MSETSTANCRFCTEDGDLDECLFEKYWELVQKCAKRGIDPSETEIEEVCCQYQDDCSEDETDNNKKMRHLCYKYFVLCCHGKLGKKNRVELPQCVTEGIKKVYPSLDGAYTGYKSLN